MRLVSADAVHAQKVAELGLDHSALDLTSVEALACAIRRSASFQCPCTASSLVRSVVQPMRGLVDMPLETIRDTAEQTVEAMVALGDLLEQADVAGEGERRRTLLYAAPPAFVERRSGVIILVGIAAEQISPLPDEITSRVEYVNHLRLLRPEPGEMLSNELLELGLIQISYERWLKTPSFATPEQHIAKYRTVLDVAVPSRDIPGLLLLDSERSVKYYLGRWVSPKSHTGQYVGRRPQAFGADLWCYVKCINGRPERLIDLPLKSAKWRGSDEAWHLQMAIDASRKDPQRYRLSPANHGHVLIEFFSPVPMWARRRWNVIGEPIPKSGCLFAYRLRAEELEEEIAFLQDMLWMAEMPNQ